MLRSDVGVAQLPGGGAGGLDGGLRPLGKFFIAFHRASLPLRIHYLPRAPPKGANRGARKKYGQNHYKIYSRIFRFVIDFWERCATMTSDPRVKLHTEVSSWLLLSLTSACPAVPARLSAPPKRSIWASSTTRSTPASAWSAVPARLSAPLRRLFRSNPQKRKKGRLASLFFCSVLPPSLREDGDAREARDDPSLLAWPISREAVTEGVEKTNG